MENFKTKIEKAEGSVYVDVGFWGGVIPGNQVNIETLFSINYFMMIITFFSARIIKLGECRSSWIQVFFMS